MRSPIGTQMDRSGSRPGIASSSTASSKPVSSWLKPAIAEVNAALLTTLAACGEVVRTVTTISAPLRDAVHGRLEAEAHRLSTYFLPRTRGYHEIWVEGAPGENTRVPCLPRTRGYHEIWVEGAPGENTRVPWRSRTPSTASAICRANSRSVSRSPRTTRSMSGPTTSRSWHCSTGNISPATISRSAAVTG
jgi:hypothetical protein